MAKHECSICCQCHQGFRRAVASPAQNHPQAVKSIFLGIALSIGSQIPFVFADDFAFSQWAQMTKEWKRGFATAIVLDLTTVVIDDEAPNFPTTMSYKKCFQNGISDDVMVALIDNYFSRNPAAFSDPMVAVVRRAMREACAPHFQK